MGFMKKNTNMVLIWSALLIVVSLIVFPSRFGLQISAGIFIYAVFEIIYYMIVFYVLRLRTSWLDIFQSAGLTFVYRIALGTVFGIILTIMYSMDLSVALTIALSRYFPAVLLHIIAAPLVMRYFYVDMPTVSRPRESRRASGHGAGTITAKRPTPSALTNNPARKRELSGGGSNTSVSHETNGFERAVRYLGEHHAVILAAVVDCEGLTMSTYKRGDIDAELWTPMSLVLQEENARILKRCEKEYRSERLDLFFSGKKLVINQVSGYSLLVLSNFEVDDLLGIRISQAGDIIRKYVSERYGVFRPLRAEEKYVSST